MIGIARMANHKNKGFRDRLCEFGCWACLKDGHGYAPAEPHHPRDGEAGMSQKADDEAAIPLCRKHHILIHADPIGFRLRYGTEKQINQTVREWMGG